MLWFVIAVLFMGLWLAERVFGLLTGTYWFLLAELVAFVYLGTAVNRLKSAQMEQENELQRLRRLLKTLQDQVKAPAQSQEQAQQSAFVVDEAIWPDAEGHGVGEESLDATLQEAGQADPEPSDEATPFSDVPITPPIEKDSFYPENDPWLKDDEVPGESAPGILETWLAGGNWIVRGGLAILFIGLVFLAKFAYDNALLPLELRLAAIAGFAIALLVVGWRARIERPVYGLSLQGGGVAALYLTIFATAKMTAMLPPLAAMGLMLLIAVLSAWLAILQDALTMAVIGAIGGFMTPILMSTGQGSHIALFSYFAALDVGILTVALQKAWRPLNVLAFFFTYGIAGLWGIDRYQPEYQLSCLLFLALFFMLFVAVSMLFTRHQTNEGQTQKAIDATLLFGVPTATFGYGLILLETYEYGGAGLAVLLSAIYLALAYFAKAKSNLAQLTKPWAALSLLCATLAVPLAFDAQMTSSIWALEGAAVISYAWRQKQTKTRWFGYLLVLLGTLGCFAKLQEMPSGVPIFNGMTMGLLVLVLAYGVIGWAVNQNDDNAGDNKPEPSGEATVVSWIMAVAMAGTGGLAILLELFTRYPGTTAGIATPYLFWLWGLAIWQIGRFARWRQAVVPVLLLPLLTIILPVLNSLIHESTDASRLWGTAIALVGLLAWQAIALKKVLPDIKKTLPDKTAPIPMAGHPGFAVFAFWVVILVQGRFVWSSAIIPESAWSLHGWFIPLVAAVPVVLTWWLARPAKNPDNNAGNAPSLWLWLHGDDELPDVVVNKKLRVFGLLTVIYIVATTLLHSGKNAPGLAYMPVLNLYELIALGGLFALLRRIRNTPVGSGLLGGNRPKLLGILAFLFANSILSRILVNFYGAEFSLGFAWHSAIAATTYSIVWSITALVIMWLASRKAVRGFWIAGAILLGVVAVKLLMIDLSKVGSLARIISFIGVGVWMLVVGYVAPIPTEKRADKSQYHHE
jgi:uncharacterized membrane protein